MINNVQPLMDKLKPYLEDKGFPISIFSYTTIGDNSYMVVDNFPHITRRYLFLLNLIINSINNKIKEQLDNHPNLYLQYLSLYNYLVYLMQKLLFSMNLDHAKSLVLKYESRIEKS